MTPAEAEKLGLDQHWRNFYVDDGKANMAPLGERKWFKLASLELGNCTDLYPKGDNVGVVTTWKPPNPLEGVTGDDFETPARDPRRQLEGQHPGKGLGGIPIAKALDKGQGPDRDLGEGRQSRRGRGERPCAA